MNAYIIAGFRSAVGKAHCLRQAGEREFRFTPFNSKP
jgi:hypothetical protein